MLWENYEFLIFLGMNMQKRMNITVFIRVFKTFWVFFTLLGNKPQNTCKSHYMGKRNDITINMFFLVFLSALGTKTKKPREAPYNKNMFFSSTYVPKTLKRMQNTIMEKQNNISKNKYFMWFWALNVENAKKQYAYGETKRHYEKRALWEFLSFLDNKTGRRMNNTLWRETKHHNKKKVYFECFSVRY